MSSSEGGGAQGSVQTVITSFVVNGAIAIVFLVLTIILRPRFRHVYEKRVVTATVPENRRPRELSPGPFAWIKDLLTRPDTELIKDLQLDGYFFIRYLRLMFLICAFGTVFLCVLLLPINGTGGAGNKGFDLLTFGNIRDDRTNRYYAHTFGTWAFTLGILWLLYRELTFYVGCRQALLTSESYRTRLSSRTILVNGVSKSKMTEEHFRKVYSGVKYVFLARDSKELAKVVKERDGLVSKVEATENKILMKAMKTQAKQQKKGVDEKGPLESYLKKGKWPTHRLKKWGLPIGEKVETLAYAKKQIPLLNEKITKLQTSRETHDPLIAAFITFHSQRDAEQACQTLGSYQPYHLTPRFIGIAPSEVIWSNLSLPWYRRTIQNFGSTALAFLVCIFWCIPTAFVGSISQINVVKSFAPFAWIGNLPNVLQGLISSLLPTILLAVLMMLLPPFLRWMARVGGAPSTVHVEYFVQQVFFVFQVVQVFIVTTLAASVVSTLQDFIGNPDIGSIVMSTMSQKVPGASNFFLAYIVLQALTVPFGAIFQIVAVILFLVLGSLLDNTPRKRWNRRNLLGGTGWGTVFPVYSNLALIVLCYSGIAPLILPFGMLLFGFNYFAFTNNLSMCVGTTNGRGIFYARALYQTFCGIYLSQVVMIILFVFHKAWGPVAIQVVLILFVIYVHINFNKAFDPLLFSLPEDLLVKENPTVRTRPADVEKSSYRGAEFGEYRDAKESFDLRSDYRSDQAPLSGAARSNEKSYDSAGLIERNASVSGPDPGRGTLMQRFFKPHIYYQADNLKRHLFIDHSFQSPAPELSHEVESTAYYNPAFSADNPVVWFPADPNGWADEQMDELRQSDINAYTTGARYVVSEKHKVNFQTSNNVADIPVYTKDHGF